MDLKHHKEGSMGLILNGSLELKGRLRRLQIHPLILPVEEGTDMTIPGEWALNIGGRDTLSASEGYKPWDKISFINSLDIPHAGFHESKYSQELFCISMGGPWITVDDPCIS